MHWVFVAHLLAPTTKRSILNSVYFVEPIIKNDKFSFTIWTHTTSLTFDLTSDQEKLQRNIQKSEETFR